MPKAKSTGRRAPPSSDPRGSGQRAFLSGRFDQAIGLWTPAAKNDPALRPALAEAHFRRALASPASDPVADLRRALELAPNELRYRFHLGRALHHTGDYAGAGEQYRAVLERQPSHADAAQLLALVALGQHIHTDLSGLPGFGPALQSWAAPAQLVLRGQVPPDDGTALGQFWRGLGLVATHNPAARQLLADERSLPNPVLNNLRRYYRGVAAAQAGDSEEALKLWQYVYQTGGRPAGLEDNLAVLIQTRLAALAEAGDIPAAAELARQWANLSGNAAFDEQRLIALDRGARAAAAGGDWPGATTLWEAAREILAGAQNLGSPRPILHNLALAYERQELWEPAADAWRALLRTRTRRRDNEDTNDAARWAWVRERIITCYRNADRPDEAVAVFRQALKADPNDLDMRVQLADALLANDQERAAYNEVKRILQIDPHHPEALLRQASYHSARWEYQEAERIAREVAGRHPDRPDLLRRVANLFLQHGRQMAGYGRYEVAYNAFVEGERYQPDNALFPINQARMLIFQQKKRPKDVAALIERALSLAGDSVELWVRIIETWQMADRIDEARALIERFEREVQSDAAALVLIATGIMQQAAPPPAPSFALFAPPAPPKPVDTPWTRLALELFDKAMAASPNDKQMAMSIATLLMLPRPDLARTYAEAAERIAPDDPDVLILLGLVLGLGDEVKQAKATLSRAAQLARRQGRRDLQEQAREMRNMVGTPFLRTMIQAGLGGIDPFGDFDEDELDFDLDDFLE